MHISARNLHLPETMRRALRPGVQALRRLPVIADIRRQQGRGRWVVFLPAEGPQGAALLRIYNVADALRSLGWRTIVLPHHMSLAERHRFLARLGSGVLVMQGARHVLNRPALYPGWPVLYDMDDADFHLPHLAHVVRQAMPDVSAVLAGSTYIADWCRAAGAKAHVVWTGTPVSISPSPAHAKRPAVIAWAQTRPTKYIREAALIRQVVADIGARRSVRLRLYDRHDDDDPAFAAGFKAPGVTVEWVRTMSYRDYLKTFDDVAIGLAPLCPENPFSRGKSFGKILAYLDRRVPVIASDVGEHGAFFTGETGVVTNTLSRWSTEAVRLLDDPSRRQDIADAAHAAFQTRLSLSAAGTAMDVLLRRYAPVTEAKHARLPS